MMLKNFGLVIGLVLAAGLAQAADMVPTRICRLNPRPSYFRSLIGVGDGSAVIVKLTRTYEQLVDKKATLEVLNGATSLTIVELDEQSRSDSFDGFNDVISVVQEKYLTKNVASLEFTRIKQSDFSIIAKVGVLQIDIPQANGSKIRIISGLLCD